MTKYFDYASTTPCSIEVISEMQKYWENEFGNSNSRTHVFGWNAEAAIEKSREIIANALSVLPSEIVFTSGATEANNLALKGYARGASYNGKKIAALVTEHKCIIESLRDLNQTENIQIDFIPVKNDGLIDMEYLKNNINQYSLISVSYVNNETGVIQDIPAISKICRENKVKLHTDAAQAFGKIPINARDVDLLSLSGHKIYGPKGVGALYISKTPRIRIKALIHGGGQEHNIRSGTLPTPLCVGLGKAAEICMNKMNERAEKYRQYEQYICENVVKKIPHVSINGAVDSKVANILNLSIPYVEGESLLMRLNQFALSSGSACTSKSLEPSYVITAMHPDEKELAHSSLRISFGVQTTMEDVKELAEQIIFHVSELRDLSPLWHMVQNGINLKTIIWKK